jgi:hypothetical protein
MGIPYIDEWRNDSPLESQAGYLDRLRLWLPGERARVSPQAFNPEIFSYDLTVAPDGPLAATD